MCILGILLFFLGLVSSNGLEILNPTNFWGLLFWCFIGLWVISGIFIERIPADNRTYRERYEQQTQIDCRIKREELYQKLYA